MSRVKKVITVLAKEIKKEDLKRFFEEIASDYTVIAPVRKGEDIVYAEVEIFDDVVLEYTTTITPVKKFLLPYKETMFSFEKEKIREKLPEENIALFGLHICDINAIARLDRVFWNDPYYRARRDNLLIVGITCKPSEKCFCKSVNAHILAPVCDVFLRAHGNGYQAVSFTETGRKKLNSFLFTQTQTEIREIKAEYEEGKHLDVHKVSENLLRNYENPVWEETAKKCLGCTNCTVVCPLCYCYDVVDNTHVKPEEGERVRCWDSCFLLNFARVAGGHNFRKDLKSRYRNVYTHKFRTFVDEFGVPACVGCGRCVTYCPAGIDMRETLTRVGGA
ncbi:MAG: 4Fe-4S dicluster domain-containing protein [Thermoplasmata archaeon]|nr:4Fe-4S dicluster domain-containing protein [Thermoplasmata archaeon]